MMKMWRPEPLLSGPERATVRDIVALNRVFAESFTDRYRRDGLVGVRVPHLNQRVWRYALDDAGAGAMLWRDERHEVVAFNIAHRSGVEGWMGPLAVRPDRQREGVGKAVVRAAADWLIEQGVGVLGLETMPRTVDNIGFYSRLGFRPEHLTITLTTDVPRRPASIPDLLSVRSQAARDEGLRATRAAVSAAAPGYDFTREIELTAELGLGDTTMVEEDGLEGFALWHSAPLAEGRPKGELRVLKLFARDEAAFQRLTAAVEASASRVGLRRVVVRCQTRFASAYRALIQRGYVARWTDLRMIYEGYPEQPTEQAILFSNWEI